MRNYGRGIKNEKGAVFVATMISMLIMVILGTSMFNMSDQGFYYMKRLKYSTEAFYLAEAGLAKALGTLKDDWANRTNGSKFPLTSLGPGTYDATVTDMGGNRVYVSSVGTVQGVSRTASAEATGAASSILDYSIAGSNVTISLQGQSSVTLTGEVYSGGNTVLSAQAGSSAITMTLSGNVDAVGNVTTSGSGAVTMGTATNGAATSNYPTISYADYQSVAQTGGGVYVNGNIDYDSGNPIPSPVGRVIYVTGNVSISDNQTTTAALVTTGNITISDGIVTLAPPSNYPALLTTGNITISGTGSGGADLTATGLIYSSGNFLISGNHHVITITGAIIAQGNVKIGDGGYSQSPLTLNYVAPNGLLGFTTGGSSGVDVESFNS